MPYILPLPLTQIISQGLNKCWLSTHSLVVPIPILGQSLIETTFTAHISSHLAFEDVVQGSYISNKKAPLKTADKKTAFLRKMELCGR